MKKKLFLCVLVSLMFTSLMGQSQTFPIDLQVESERYAYAYRFIPMEQDEDNYYLYRASYLRGYNFFYAPFLKPLTYDYIYSIDKMNNKTTKVQVMNPDNYYFHGCFENENEIIGIYAVSDDKTKEYTIEMNSYEKGSRTYEWNPREIASYNYERKDDSYLTTAISPDKSKIVIVYMQVNKKNLFKGAAVMTFNNRGELLWENHLDLEFQNKTFAIEDCAIDNEGSVYLPIVSYVEAKKSRTDEQLHLYRISENNSVEAVEDVSFGFIEELKLKILKNGNIFIGGYYKTELGIDDNEAGYFGAFFDVQTDNFSNLVSTKFPSSYKEKRVIYGGNLTPKLDNQQHQVKCEEIFELDNGKIVLIGEQSKMYISRGYNNNAQNIYYYYAKNILYNLFSADGNAEEFKMIKKAQYYSSTTIYDDYNKAFISFNAFQKGNDIYFVFNDNLENYTGKQDKVYKMNWKKTCTVLVKMNENGEEERNILLNSKTQKKIFQTLLFVNGNDLIIHGINKKYSELSRVLFED